MDCYYDFWELIRMRRILPSLPALEAFEAVARIGHVTRAAEELGRTQSAISRQIANLEDFARRPLFVRSRKRLVLNEAGESFYLAVSRLLNDLEIETARLLTFGSTEHVLRLGVLPTFGSRWLMPRLAEFKHDFDDIELHLVRGLSSADFARERVDAAFECSEGEPQGLEHYKLLEEEIVAVATPEHYAEIMRGSGIFNKLHMPSRPELWRRWSDVSPAPDIQSGLQFENYSMMIEAVSLGLGVAVLPTIYIGRELGSKRLISPFGVPIKSGRSYWLTFPGGTANHEKVRAFAEWIIDQSRETAIRSPQDASAR